MIKIFIVNYIYFKIIILTIKLVVMFNEKNSINSNEFQLYD